MSAAAQTDRRRECLVTNHFFRAARLKVAVLVRITDHGIRVGDIDGTSVFAPADKKAMPNG